jgi:hypothetical protein
VEPTQPERDVAFRRRETKEAWLRIAPVIERKSSSQRKSASRRYRRDFISFRGSWKSAAEDEGCQEKASRRALAFPVDALSKDGSSRL